MLHNMIIFSIGYVIGYTLYIIKSTFNIVRIARFVPLIHNMIKFEKLNLKKQLEEKYMNSQYPIYENLPKDGIDPNVLLSRFQKNDKLYSYKNTGALYINDPILDNYSSKICEKTLRDNPLHVELCNDTRQIENEIIRMIANLYHGDEKVVGNLTSGGTDSIFHAVYTAKERGKHYGLLSNWEMIIPSTAHPAFRKSAQICEIKIIECPVDSTFKCCVKSLEKLITNRTILIVGSTPSFPHGVCDPIQEMSNILEKNDPDGIISFHIDSCLGSTVSCFLEHLLPFDFRVSRTTSISSDLHKYGYTIKGSSAILYRNHKNYRYHQIFVDHKFPGGIYATPGMAGSRPGFIIANTYFTLLYFGYNEYKNKAIRINKLAKELGNAINTIPELILMVEPEVMVVPFTSKDKSLNIYDIKSEMSNLGWYLSSLQYPNGLHFCITAVHIEVTDFIDLFINDLKLCIDKVKHISNGNSSEAIMYKSNYSFGIKEIVPEMIKEYWNIMGQTKPL